MQVDFAFLADAAVAGIDGKISALGLGFEEIGAPEYPATQPNMSLVVRLISHATECEREHTLEIQLWDPDGKVVNEIEATFTPHRNQSEPTRSVSMPLVLNLRDSVFERPGMYAFHIIVDGTHLKDVPLRLVDREDLLKRMMSKQQPDA